MLCRSIFQLSTFLYKVVQLLTVRTVEGARQTSFLSCGCFAGCSEPYQEPSSPPPVANCTVGKE